MADFCWDCVEPLFGIEPDRNDLMGFCDPDEMIGAICECCGPGKFDHLGKRVPGWWNRPLDPDDTIGCGHVAAHKERTAEGGC